MKDIIKKEENLVIYELINLAPFLTFIFHKKKKIFLYFFIYYIRVDLNLDQARSVLLYTT